MRKSFYNGRRGPNQTPYRRTTTAYPSSNQSADPPGANTAPREKQAYSGSLVVGIATMHKSNAVPVTSGIGTNPKITT